MNLDHLNKVREILTRPPYVAVDSEAVYAPMWDRRFIPAAPRSPADHCFEFFQGPVGTLEGGKHRTYADTNMYLQGQIVDGTNYLATGFEVYFTPDRTLGRNARLDTVRLLTAGVFEFTVGNRIYLRMTPLAAFPPAFPMYAAYDDDKLAEILVSDRWRAEGEGIRKLPRGFEVTPIYLQPRQCFGVKIMYDGMPELLEGGHLGVIIDGFLYRPRG